jgi:hypothetical protein
MRRTVASGARLLPIRVTPMTDLVQKIYKVLQEFVEWFWHGLHPPPRKPWCAVFYFVAQEDAGMDYPETSLDDKLEATIDALKADVSKPSFEGDKIHVVYRAVWAGIDRNPVAAVISSSILPAETDYFAGCPNAAGMTIDTGKDLPCFLEWAYKWCPADHYAIFLWGHSFGPAGLFEPGGTFGIPRPTGLAALREAFDQFSALRASSPPAASVPAYESSYIAAPGPPATPSIDAMTQAIDGQAGANPQVEVVLFQDCWMSTLETAYELRDVVRYVIASQSLLPIGIDYAEFVWPYEQLLKDLLTVDFQEQLTGHISDFYDANFNEIATLITVPMALLDLSGVTNITQPLIDLVTSLNQALTLDQRGLLIEQGQIVTFDQKDSSALSAGDTALMDVRQMCEQMELQSNPGISSAATSLLAALGSVVKVTRESLPPLPGGQPVGFGGISVLYRPPPARLLDEYITQALHKASYLNLEFSKQTGWPATEQKRN